jgi:nucleoid-associated protein Lsr2
MVTHRRVVLVDDLDGGEADETVSFALDGRSFEIDLSKSNAAALRKSLDEYISHARREGGPATRSRKSSPPTNRDPAQTHNIRTWAQSNGHQVSSRGRIPAAVVQAYQEAHAA